MNIAGYDYDEPMIYGRLAIEAHDAKIRAKVLREAEAKNSRLKEAGNKMARFISTWQDCLANVQMSEKDFNTTCGLSDWLKARDALEKED
jgi:hypothetical protein